MTFRPRNASSGRDAPKRPHFRQILRLQIQKAVRLNSNAPARYLQTHLVSWAGTREPAHLSPRHPSRNRMEACNAITGYPLSVIGTNWKRRKKLAGKLRRE